MTNLLFVQPGTPRGKLQLSLHNLDGYPQDAYNVRWTVFKQDGTQVSGSRLPANKVTTGVYQATWNCSDTGGCYKVQWEYQVQSGSLVEQFCEDFFITTPSYYYDYLKAASSGLPLSTTCKAFYCGQTLGESDLVLYLKGPDGFPATAYAVYWTILNECGCPVTTRTEATPGSIAGSYYAPYYVNLAGGDYKIKWEFMESSDSPLQATCMNFSVICTNLFNVCSTITRAPSCEPEVSCQVCCVPIINICPSFVPSVSVVTPQQCCSFEIPRVVHLLTQNLPTGGAYTQQPPYLIPSRIRTIIFYITYTRGAAGGFGLFKLMWGNGTEEIQSTMIDLDYHGINPANSMQDMYVNVLKGPEPIDNNPVSFGIEAKIPGGSTTVRLLAAEGGVLGAPGVVTITLTAASD